MGALPNRSQFDIIAFRRVGQDFRQTSQQLLAALRCEMDSELQIVERLLTEGEQFTWESFCFPSVDFPGKYGGEDRPEWLAWKTRVRRAVENSCAKDGPARILVEEADKVPTEGYGQDKFRRARSTFMQALLVLREALKEDTFGELETGSAANTSPRLSNRVFVVHGHDSGLKTDLERFLHEVGLEPVVLHRQPDEGNTVIEKFEKHSDVGYAFILLTPDEIAYTSDQEQVKDAERKKERRARPNVIFEFGFFVGLLGRARVCCLYKGDVTIPSDLSGFVYKQVDGSIDQQAWSIIRELQAAGYQINVKAGGKKQ